MKVSYEWLQSYFDEALPQPMEVAETLTFHAFEIEGVEKVGDLPAGQAGDTMIDVDVLPNRSSDCMSHRGIARELATLLGRELKDDPLKKEVSATPDSNILEVSIGKPELINRFSAAVISNVEVGESPEWMKKRLATIGQKSINNVVDATNYVMFDIGQPLHAFDRDKLSEKDGGYVISVRSGKGGEKIMTLTGEEYEVGEDNLLIVDGVSDKAIGIAGIKGGKDPEVDKGTKNLVIEGANFNYTNVRKTSQHLKLRTDASARFENEPSPELTLYALHEVVKLLGGTLEGFVDDYKEPSEQKAVSVTVSEINGLLGVTISEDEVENILKRLGFEYTRSGEGFTVTPPFERTDINIKEDLIEEVGRVYGYSHVEAKPLPEQKEEPKVNKRFYYAEKVRKLLVEQGFSEVYTYSLQSKGKVELANALASDRPYLRSGLDEGMKASLELNSRNVDLLGLDQIRIFEIGTVFSDGGEHMSLALGVKQTKKSKKSEEDVLNEIAELLGSHLDVKLPETKVQNGVFEVNFDELVEKLPEPNSINIEQEFDGIKEKKFEPISAYPFVLRDIAVLVPTGTKAGEVLDVIKGDAGELLVRSRLFDEFEKDEKISYAFHLVFQAGDRTLSDVEVNKVMENITNALISKGQEVR